jgi:hypothetical protein
MHRSAPISIQAVNRVATVLPLLETLPVQIARQRDVLWPINGGPPSIGFVAFFDLNQSGWAHRALNSSVVRSRRVLSHS